MAKIKAPLLFMGLMSQLSTPVSIGTLGTLAQMNGLQCNRAATYMWEAKQKLGATIARTGTARASLYELTNKDAFAQYAPIAQVAGETVSVADEAVEVAVTSGDEPAEVTEVAA